jgi:hypothetical protein
MSSFDDTWDWATGAEREAFVIEHHSELKKIIAKIDRREARFSSAQAKRPPSGGVVTRRPRFRVDP